MLIMVDYAEALQSRYYENRLDGRLLDWLYPVVRDDLTLQSELFSLKLKLICYIMYSLSIVQHASEANT